MKAPGGTPRKLSEEEKKSLIKNAQTIEELCSAIKQIGPLSKGFLKGRTDVNNAIKLIVASCEPGVFYSDIEEQSDVRPYFLLGGNIMGLIRYKKADNRGELAALKENDQKRMQDDLHKKNMEEYGSEHQIENREIRIFSKRTREIEFPPSVNRKYSRVGYLAEVHLDSGEWSFGEFVPYSTLADYNPQQRAIDDAVEKLKRGRPQHDYWEVINNKRTLKHSF